MTPPSRPAWYTRLLISAGVGLGCAILLAIGLAILDLYLSGHNQPPLSRPWVDHDRLGVHLSRADAICLLGALLGSVLTWRASGRSAA